MEVEAVRNRKILKLGGAAIVFASLLAACGSSSSANSTKKSSSQSANSGVVTYAEQPGATPNYIFWLTPGTDFSVANNDQFQYLMWRPMYVFGVGNKAEINYSLSIGNKPVFSNGNKTVTISLKNWKFSDGQPITARNIVFWMNLLKANKTDWGAYVPGEFPDNVVSTTAVNAHTVRFQLNASYSPTWFTYNELSQVVPIPMAWDRTSLSAPAPTASTPNLPDTTASGARAVYKFLNAQATDLATYASSPIWSVVDGPWKLKSFTTEGKAVFVPNKLYSGPVKPTIKEFVELPFTSDSGEFNVLAAGNNQITYGYLPSSDIQQRTRIESTGYGVSPWTVFGFNYIPMNYNSPTYGPVYHQLYFRQALEHLIDQPAWIHTFLAGYGVPSYSPVPIAPANPFVDSYTKKNPYPYSTNAAKNLLTSHGWKLVNGVMTCESPGTTATECGSGVSGGTNLSGLQLQYASGVTSLQQEMEAFASAAKSIGVDINLTSAPFNTVISGAGSCTPSQPSCKWQMVNWGGGWTYGPDFLPTGGAFYLPGAGANPEGYSNSKATALINQTHTSSNTAATLAAYQDFMANNLPVLYQPFPASQVSAISTSLHGVTQNPYGILFPEEWRLK